MDNNNTSLLTDRQSASKNVNGSARRPSSMQPKPMDSPNHASGQSHIVQVVVNRDEKGYGMKVSGDNPVYVQSVKEGGPAARGGLHAGDKIIKVNGINVMSYVHTEVVDLIKGSSVHPISVQGEIGGSFVHDARVAILGIISKKLSLGIVVAAYRYNHSESILRITRVVYIGT